MPSGLAMPMSTPQRPWVRYVCHHNRCYDGTELRHYRPENNGQIVQLANRLSSRESPLVIQAEMTKDPQGAMQVQRKGKRERDAFHYLGEPSPTVLPPVRLKVLAPGTSRERTAPDPHNG